MLAIGAPTSRVARVFCAFAVPWRPEVDPVARISELNRWLRDYARV